MSEKKARQSNLELLRIIAMFMVIVLHSTFTTFGYARANMVQAHPTRWLGIITTGVGITGVYIGKIYTEVKRRPRYFIEERV